MFKDCKQCNHNKPLTEFYSHPLTKDGTINRCKECVKLGRRSEKEREMARAHDILRAKTPKRIAKSKIITERFRTANPLKWTAECMVNNYIRKLKKKWWQKPSHSFISNELHSHIHLHHPDYEKPFEVVPCTPSEHRKIHLWQIIVEKKHILNLKEIWLLSTTTK